MKTFYQLERNRRRALHADVWYTGEVLPDDIGLTRPPQSWRYLTDEQAAILRRKNP